MRFIFRRSGSIFSPITRYF